MIKKILTTAAFIALLALLIFGGVIRTRAVYGITGSDTTTSNGNGRNNGNSHSLSETEATANEWIALQGTVQSWDGSDLVVLTNSGQSILIEGRSARFLSENYFSAEVGDQIRLTGYFEGETFEVGTVTNLTNGMVIRLRSADGVPAWGGGDGD